MKILKDVKRCVIDVVKRFRDDFNKEEVKKIVEGIVEKSNPMFVPVCLYWVDKYWEDESA